MAQELLGKIAVITGAAGGIGAATAKLLVAEGAKVVLADVDEKKGQLLTEKLGPAAVFRRTDVSLPQEVQELIDFAVSHFGGLDVMFNNAAIAGAQHSRFLDDRLEDFQRVLDINLFGVMTGSQAAARVMARNGGGVIINNASIAGLLPGHALMTYRASKAAVIMFSRSVAIDFAEFGIRVNCLAPGHIRTPLTSFAPPGAGPEVVARVKKAVGAAFDVNQPLKRTGYPDDVAQAVLFLASARAAQITGIVLPIDGGITAGDPVNHLIRINDARAEALSN